MANLLVLLALLATITASPAAAFGVACDNSAHGVLPHQPHLLRARSAAAKATKTAVDRGLTIAITGDTILGKDTLDVYKLIKAEGASAVVINGDLDYKDDPARFISQLDGVLPQTPVFISVGNHDLRKWAGYADVIAKRYKRLGMDKYCTGEVGVKSTCSFGGVTIVTSGVGTRGAGHETFLDQALAAAPADAWKLVGWHKNQEKLNVGDKNDEVGWAAYETCLKHGALVFNAHNHGYSRTHLLSSFESQTIVSKSSSDLTIRPGRSLVAVTGTGGRFLYGDGPYASAEWWATKYTADDGSSGGFGALFCKFNESGTAPNRARCYFKTTKGTILDQFAMTLDATPARDLLVKRDPKKCTAHHVEAAAVNVPLTQDGVSGLVDLKRADVPTTLAFALPVPAVPEGSKVVVDHAFLQMYGAATVADPDAVTLSVSADSVKTAVAWQFSGDAERHEVWNSADLRTLVAPAVADAAKAGKTAAPVTLTVRPQSIKAGHVGDVKVYGVHPDKCLNPSLVAVVRVCKE
ncbi:hypothetical protein H9P43_000192 [Blastocladiella emersonii ATCC 22665]|nr:hypothetical protein H9P43_000192 [Blastocladiella emersonii ATCC 22665]